MKFLIEEENRNDVGIILAEKRHQAVVNSRTIAEHFEKRHDNVLRDIDNLIISLLKIEESTNNFFKTKYIDNRGKEQREFLLNRDAFTVLAMGFSGDKALKWKMNYSRAFNQMEDIIKQRRDTEWLQTRQKGKMQRRETTDALQMLIPYAVEQGSTTYEKKPGMCYTNYSNLVNSIVCIEKGQRDNLDRKTLIGIEFVEDMISETIIEEMQNKTYYKDIYQKCKEKGKVMATGMRFAERATKRLK